MTDWTKLLRLLVQANKEAKITAVTAHGDPAIFTSRLTSGETRKGIAVYSNTDAASGECFIGYTATADPSGESLPVPHGAHIDLPIADCDAINLYYGCVSGELGDLRIEEYA